MQNDTKKLTTIESRLQKLVAMPTVSSDPIACGAAITAIANECEILGLHTKIYTQKSHSLVATSQPTKTPKVMLVMHIDVVPAVNDSQYIMSHDSTKLYGRGVYDMKFALACALEFFYRHKTKLADLDIGLMVTTDEEIGGSNGAGALVNDGWRPKVAIIPDGGNNWKIEKQAKGLALYKLAARGQSAHSSLPWQGQNAINKLLKVLQEINTKYPSDHPINPSVSINEISGGSAINQVPDYAEAYVDFRAFKQTELNQFDQWLKRLCQGSCINLSKVISGDCLQLYTDNTWVQTFLNCYKSVLGKSPEFSDSYGASDGRWFAKHNIPCVILRPPGSGHHGAHEWVDRAGLQTFYELIENYLFLEAKYELSRPLNQPAATVLT